MYIGKKVFSPKKWPAVRERQRTCPFLVKPRRDNFTRHWYEQLCPDCQGPMEFHDGAGGGAGMVTLIYTCDTCRAVHTYK